MDDELRLLRAMARRDRSAWADMYERHVGDVFGVAYHLLGGDRGTAEDVCQEVWLLAIERFDGFDVNRGVFRNWLLGIARHRALHHRRRMVGEAANAETDSQSEALPPLGLLELSEQADVVRAALLCLESDHRRVLQDKYADGLSVSEIANRTGRSAKAVEYHDTTLRIVTKYVVAEGVIHRLPANPELRNPDPDFFQQLLESKGPAKSPVFGMDVVAQNRREVVEEGRRWVDIELTLKVIAGDRKQTMRFRVDPETKLPHSCIFQSIEGPIGTRLFDYPDRGPADIYDLGVPRTAKLVDRMPSNDLNRVLAGLKAGRVRFDDYRAIADMGGLGVKRVWRKGRKWRAEILLPSPKQAEQYPRDADAAWWKAHQSDFTFFVQAICDGDRVYYYKPLGKGFMPDANGPPRPSLSMTQAINPSDDPFMPWPDLFPEHVSHPAVWQPRDDRDFLLEPKPDDGPPGTIRLQVRDTRFPDQHLPDVYKLWIQPQQNYMALRAEARVMEPMPANPPKIAHVETKVLESLARSPGGHWYPTRVVRKTSNFKGEQVWRYLLDFEAPLPDELFEPLKL